MLREIIQLTDAAGRARVASADALVRNNENGLRELADVLPEEYARTLVHRSKQIAFPKIVPDPASASTLYDAILSIPELPEESRVDIRAIEEVFLREHQRLTQMMCDNTTQRARIAMCRREGYGQERAALDQKIIKIGEERYHLKATQLERIRPVLTPEQLASLPEWDFETNPRRKPWDRDDEARWRKKQKKTTHGATPARV